nr:hypothetical protein [Tanacetum cinerariifolium]
QACKRSPLLLFFILRTKSQEDGDKLAAAIKEYAPTA